MTAKDDRAKAAKDVLRTLEVAENMYMAGTYEHGQVVSAALYYNEHRIKWLLKFLAGER